MQTNSFQQMLLQLRNSFLQEVPERLNLLENLLFSLEREPENSDIFNEIYRIVHSLKGSGGTHGLHIITAVCHPFEDLLSNTQQGSVLGPETINFCLQFIDLLRFTVKEIQDGREQSAQVENELKKIRQSLAPQKLNVLLIDNSKLYLSLYQEVLKPFSANVVSMSDAVVALVRALSEPFNLIVTTNETPLLNGLGLISAVKLSNHYAQYKTQTVLITANKGLMSDHHRDTDPDYILFKNAQLPTELNKIVSDVCSKIVG